MPDDGTADSAELASDEAEPKTVESRDPAADSMSANAAADSSDDEISEDEVSDTDTGEAVSNAEGDLPDSDGLDDDGDLDDDDGDLDDDLDDEVDDLEDDDVVAELDDEDDDDVDDVDDDDEDGEPVAAPVSGRRARAAAERKAAAEQTSPPNKKVATRPGTKPAKKSASTKTGSTKTGSSKAAATPGGRRGLMRFLREVIAELGKVVWPGRRELIVYTSVVIVFMAFMVALVAGLDIVFAQGVLTVFG